MNRKELVELLTPFGQEHLAQFWDELSDAEKELLRHDILNVDLADLDRSFSLVKSEMGGNAQELKLDELMKPVAASAKGSFVNSDKEQLESYEALGLKAIANGEVAVLLLAGGQGTRLGVSYPKGMYSVNLPSNKTLYQLQAERLIRVQELAHKQNPGTNGKVLWYIMTSEHTKELTVEFFKSHNYFGLDHLDVKFFEQEMLPCLTKHGKIILDEKWKISRAPDGNGGLYKALRKNKIVEEMENRGLKYVHVYGVDNILIKMADPAFIGFCVAKNANCAAKVVKKVEPDEKVGVICKVNERYQVVEYSEISEKTRNLRDENGDLTYNAGSICNHFFTAKFLNDICREHEKDLKHHVAEKKIAFVDSTGERVKPKANNGIKLEKFVFDVFPFSDNFAIWEVIREQEFSPLKNSVEAKNENPNTCRSDLSAEHVRWLLEAGALFEESDSIEEETSSETSDPTGCEISPLISYRGEGLKELVNGKILRKPLSLELDKETKKVLLNGLDIDVFTKIEPVRV